jgi:hypothetical protein
MKYIFFGILCFFGFEIIAQTVNLGRDTAICSGATYTLNAGNAGATYLWNTGQTTQTITVSTSGLYFVDVTTTSTRRDSVLVSILPVSNYSANDTSICAGINTISLANADTTTHLFTWWDAPTGGNRVTSGPRFTKNFIPGVENYYVQAFNKVQERVGYPSNVATGGLYVASQNTNGIAFNALNTISIDTVSIYISAAVTFDIILRDNANNPIYTKSFSLTGTGSKNLDLGFIVSAGTGYRLVLANRVGGDIWIDISGVVYPFNSTNIVLTSGIDLNTSVNPSRYYYFYNWKVSGPRCGTARDQMTVTVNGTSINLPSDTTHCGANLSLDVTNTNANYLWSDGSTAATNTLTSSGIYSVTVSNGTCSNNSSIDVNLLIPSQFTAVDTTICSGVSTVSLTNADPNTHLFTWWDAPTGGNRIYSGSSLTSNFSPGVQNYYIQSYNIVPETVGYIDLSSGGYYAATTQINGIAFNALEPIIIDSVTVYIDNSVTFDVELRDNLNNTIETKSFTLTGYGLRVLDLGFQVPFGTGLRLVLTNRVGGKIFIDDSGVVFPFNSNNIQLTSGVEFGTTLTTARYYYFYNWRISGPSCPSPRQPITITSVPAPIPVIPTDTLICDGSLLLDVSYPGATYQWSNGASTSSVTLLPNTEKDTLMVTVSAGICSNSDTIYYQILDSINVINYDTSICGGRIQLPITNPAGQNGVAYWWDNLSGGNLVGVGNVLDIELYDTVTYYTEIRPVEINKSEGFPDIYTLNGSSSGFFVRNGDYGNYFDVRNDIILDSISIYIDDAPMSVLLELKDSFSMVRWEKNLTLLPGVNRIHLGEYLERRNNYRVVLRNLNGLGKIFIDAPVSFPIVDENITFRNGIPVANTNFIYDWKIRRTACPGERKPITVNVLPTRNIGWPMDTIICGGNITLDVTMPNSTYLWDNNQTNPNITISSEDTVWVAVTTGPCVSRDTLNVYISTPPTQLFTSNDTIICGGEVNLQVGGNAEAYAWYNSLSSNQAIAFGEDLNVFVSDTTTYYVEGLSLLRSATVFGHSIVPVTGGSYSAIGSSFYPSRGMLFDVYKPLNLEQISIFVDSNVSARLVLKDGLGFDIQTKNITLNNIGENVVPLDWFLDTGTGYSLWIDNIQGGRLYVLSSYAYPLNYPELRIRSGLPTALSSQYSCFYKWRISTPSCATNRDSVTIFVPEYPVFTMPADTAICNGNGVAINSTAVNPGYRYLWNTGQTSSSITALVPGSYTVTVTNANICSEARNILVQFPSIPASPQIADSTICSPRTINLLQNPSNSLYVWYDPIGLQEIYIGAPYPATINDTTQFNIALAAKATTRLGELSNPNSTNLGLYESFILPNTFDVTKPVILDSIAVYLENAPASVDIVLSNSSNPEIYRRTVQVNQSRTKVFLPLNFVILPGNDYQIRLDNLGNNRFLVDNFVTYPQTSSVGAVTLTGTPFAGVSFNYFYDWHFSYALNGCFAPQRDSFIVNVSLPLNLPDSIFTCNSVIIDANLNSALIYNWNTGANSPTITADSTGYYIVTVSDGLNCFYTDTTKVQTPEPITFPNGTVLCGTVLSTNYDLTNASLFNWSTGDTTSNITISNPGTYTVSLLNAQGCLLNGSATITQLETPPVLSLDSLVNTCDSVTLNAISTGSGLQYLWSTGETSASIIATNSTTYTVTVTSSNGCTSTDNSIVNIIPAPQAEFSFVTSNNAVSFSNLSTNATSYQWYFGDSTSATQVNPFHFYFDIDCYIVTLVASNSCGSTTFTDTLGIGRTVSDCYPPIVVSNQILNNDYNNWEIFPNPNNGTFQTNILATVEQEAKLTLFSIEGREIESHNIILSKGNNQFNFIIDNLSNGVYWLRLNTKEITTTKQVVILKD